MYHLLDAELGELWNPTGNSDRGWWSNGKQELSMLGLISFMADVLGDKCYTVNVAKVDWTTARDKCQSSGPNADLVTIHDAKEQGVLWDGKSRISSVGQAILHNCKKQTSKKLFNTTLSISS